VWNGFSPTSATKAVLGENKYEKKTTRRGKKKEIKNERGGTSDEGRGNKNDKATKAKCSVRGGYQTLEGKDAELKNKTHKPKRKKGIRAGQQARKTKVDTLSRRKRRPEKRARKEGLGSRKQLKEKKEVIKRDGGPGNKTNRGSF